MDSQVVFIAFRWGLLQNVWIETTVQLRSLSDKHTHEVYCQYGTKNQLTNKIPKLWTFRFIRKPMTLVVRIIEFPIVVSFPIASSAISAIFVYVWGESRISLVEILEKFLNPSCTKLFGTHTWYQGGRPDPPAISKTLAPMNLKFCRVLETSFNILEMLKLFT